MIDFLQAQDVRSVGEDLFQDEVFPAGPAEGLQGALDKTVEPFTQSCGSWRTDFKTQRSVVLSAIVTCYTYFLMVKPPVLRLLDYLGPIYSTASL